MIYIFVNWIQKGKMTIEDVPERFRERVQKRLDEIEQRKANVQAFWDKIREMQQKAKKTDQ